MSYFYKLGAHTALQKLGQLPPGAVSVNISGMTSPDQIADAAVNATLGRGWFTPEQEAKIRSNMARLQKRGADILDVPSLSTTPEKMMKKWQNKALNKKPDDKDLFRSLKKKTLGPVKFGGVAVIPEKGDNRETFQRKVESETPNTNAPMAPDAETRDSNVGTQLNTVWSDHDARVQTRPDPSKWDYEYVSTT